MQKNAITEKLKAAKQAGYSLHSLSEDKIRAVLDDFAQALEDNSVPLIAENARDLEKMEQSNPLYDRLLLDSVRISAIAADIRKVARLPSPVGELCESRTLPNGAHLSRIRVPMGVVAVIYESRPNVTADVFSLCFRTQNACIMKGGSDADHSNRAIVALIHATLNKHGIDRECVFLMPPDRESLPVLLKSHGLVDVCIPRGSQGLIDFVRENASVPVIETGRGVVHIYVHDDASPAMANPVIVNAKTRRPSVCNTLDTLIVHRSALAHLPALLDGLADKNVAIHADPAALEVLETCYPHALLSPCDEQSLNAEFMALRMNVVTVAGLDEAMAHIRRYSSGHTEAILTQSAEAAEKFAAGVDSSSVMINASTAFADGGEYGLGAEIGISTQKLHARGPMGLEPLTSCKWILRGTGQVR